MRAFFIYFIIVGDGATRIIPAAAAPSKYISGLCVCVCVLCVVFCLFSKF